MKRSLFNLNVQLNHLNLTKLYFFEQDTETPPPRITSNLKQNLQFLRLWKVSLQLISMEPVTRFGRSLSVIHIVEKSFRTSKRENPVHRSLQPVIVRRRWRRKNCQKMKRSTVILLWHYTSKSFPGLVQNEFSRLVDIIMGELKIYLFFLNFLQYKSGLGWCCSRLAR